MGEGASERALGVRECVADPCSPSTQQAVECLVRSASGSPLLLRKSLNADESQISLMDHVPPYPGTQVPASQPASPANPSSMHLANEPASQ